MYHPRGRLRIVSDAPIWKWLNQYDENGIEGHAREEADIKEVLPNDNPVNEALNGWIKEELIIDFKLEGWGSMEEVKGLQAKVITTYFLRLVQN